MIVISGALVLVALVLLVIGLVSTALGFVYASIAVSVVSFIFLIIGVLQRRGETQPETMAPAVSATSTPLAEVEGVTAIIPPASRPAAATPAASAEAADAAPPAEGSVLVVAGRPRYHVAGCRYLTGKDADVVPVHIARGDGFAPCGVCRPDEALASLAAERTAVADTSADEAQPAALAASDLEAAEVSGPVAAARRAATRAPSRAPSRAKPTAVPVEEAIAPAARTARVAPDPRPAASAPGSRAPGSRTSRTGATGAAATRVATTRVGSTRTSRPAPVEDVLDESPPVPVGPAASRRAAAAADARPAPARAASSRVASVVVIPDRAKYHRADCRFVRDAPDAQERTKAQATRQGYAACGVCKP